MGGALGGNPAAGNNGDGRIEVFVRGTDHAVWHIWQMAPSSGPWSGWDSLGGMVHGEVAVANNGDRRFELVVRGQGQHVWHAWQAAPSDGWH